MDIERVNGYGDGRFQQAVLKQHGAFLLNGLPCEFLVTGPRTAQVSCPGWEGELPEELYEEFRFYAGHITRFTDRRGSLLKEYPNVEFFPVKLDRIQPSQFFVDEEKLRAVSEFVHSKEDVVIPLLYEKDTDRYISLDGHTRLFLAMDRGYDAVSGFLSESGEYIFDFVKEAKKRGISGVKDMRKLSHGQYEEQWNGFCDRFFAEKNA